MFNAKATKSIQFLNSGKKVSFVNESSILDLAIKEHQPIEHSCEGSGTCGTCRVFVFEGLEKLDPPNEIEIEFIEDRNFTQNERLACQTLAKDGLKIEIPTKNI